METKATSKNIMLTFEDEDLVLYRAQCGCGHEQCNHALALAYTDDMGVNLSVDTYMSLDDHLVVEKGRLAKLWFRVKCAAEALFIGRVRLEGEFLFQDERSIRDYIGALEQGVKKLKERQAA